MHGKGTKIFLLTKNFFRMIDKITLIKKNVTEKEFKEIAASTKLCKNIKNGKISYDNSESKNFSGGFFIQINHRKTLKVSGSVHKYINFIKTGKLSNSDNITMQEAKQGILMILKAYGLTCLSQKEIEVQYFEVGVNRETDIPTHKILESLCSLKMKKMYFHPRFKDETLKTTETDKDKKRIFRVYDKLQELKERKQEAPKGVKHLTRFETIYRRQTRPLNEFLSDEYLQKLLDKFVKEADELKGFIRVEYIGKSRTSPLKIELATFIFQFGMDKLITHIEEQYKSKEITYTQLKVRKDFIKEWYDKRLFYEYRPYNIIN